MNEKKIRDSFLYIEMVLATPGAKLHQGIRRLRKNRELATSILLGVCSWPVLFCGNSAETIHGCCFWPASD